MEYQSDCIRIIGMSAAVPKEKFDNIAPDCEDKRLKQLVKMTGIYRRHAIDPGRIRLVDMSIAAARDCIEKSKVTRDRIRFIINITQHPEFRSPSTAFYVQKELGLGLDCMVFDVNLGCSGFVAGIQIAASLIRDMPDGSVALLINAEYLSAVKRENENDRLLFGDAASAVLIEKNAARENRCISDYYSDGNRYQAIFHESCETGCVMDGQAVFNFSVYEVSDYIKRFLEKHGLNDDSIDHIAFHQAQKFIIDHIATNAKLDRKKLLYSLDEYGNTSGASIPLSICKNADKLKEHGRYLLSGFGIGLAWGIAYLEIDRENVFGVIDL